jgi:hypothetical protein
MVGNEQRWAGQGHPWRDARGEHQPHQRTRHCFEKADAYPAGTRPPGPARKNDFLRPGRGCTATVSAVAQPPAFETWVSASVSPKPSAGFRSSSRRRSPTVLTSAHTASSSSRPKRVSRIDCSCTMARLSRCRSSMPAGRSPLLPALPIAATPRAAGSEGSWGRSGSRGQRLLRPALHLAPQDFAGRGAGKLRLRPAQPVANLLEGRQLPVGCRPLPCKVSSVASGISTAAGAGPEGEA